MWDIRLDYCGDNTENTVKLWIQTHARMTKSYRRSRWILERDRSQQFFSDFLSGSLGDETGQRQKHNNLSVNVSVSSGCLPLARINISNLTPDEVPVKAVPAILRRTANQKSLDLPGPTSTSNSTPTADGGGSRLKLYILIPTALVCLLILIIAIIIVLKVASPPQPSPLCWLS